jgi:ATP-dependent Clp protease ATP-binding subunit ClpC
MLSRTAQRIVDLAEETAALFGHCYLGTEHVLLAGMEEGSSSAARALKESGVTMDRLREKVAEISPPGKEDDGLVRVKTENFDAMIMLAEKRNMGLGLDVIYPSDLLDAIMQLENCKGFQVIVALNLQPAKLREIIARKLRE